MSPTMRLRCLTVYSGVTAAWVVGLVALGDELAASVAGDWPTSAFDACLAQGAAVVAAAAGGWVWLVATVTVVEAAWGLPAPRTTGRLRRLVLVACGVALAGAVTAPAGASPPVDPGGATPPAHGGLLDGLPLPERASTTARPAHHGAQPVERRPVAVPAPRPAADPSVVVRPGDSLWSIAAAGLPPGADLRTIDARWRAIHAANRLVVGSDPDLIRPGQRLLLPPP